MDQERRQRIIRILVNEERGFVLRIGWSVAIAAVLCSAYFFYSGARYDLPVVHALDASGGDSDCRAAFEALKSPNFFSGIKEPSSLIPEGDPLLDGLRGEVVVDYFVQGEAFVSLQAPRGVRLQKFLKEADSRNLTPERLKAAEKISPDFARYLTLRAKAYDPALIVGDTEEFCRGYAPCVAGVLERRYPKAYNALVLLYRYAHKKEFTPRSIAYAKRNLGYFVEVRQMAYDRGFPTLKSDRAVLLALREMQRASVHNTLISAVFLMIMAALYLGSVYGANLWRNALLSGAPSTPAVAEASEEGA